MDSTNAVRFLAQSRTLNYTDVFYLLTGHCQVNALKDAMADGSHEAGVSVRSDLHTGALVRALRERRGLSMRALARRAGVSPMTLSQLEANPRANPTLETLLRLQQALELASVEQLLGGLEEMPSAQLAERAFRAR
jgi:DNA-binding XRE family transcriptional regulator